VKLVSRPGVGTIAAGVAKAYADLITISGFMTVVTAASPLTLYQVCWFALGVKVCLKLTRLSVLMILRDKVRVQTDGGFEKLVWMFV